MAAGSRGPGPARDAGQHRSGGPGHSQHGSGRPRPRGSRRLAHRRVLADGLGRSGSPGEREGLRRPEARPSGTRASWPLCRAAATRVRPCSTCATWPRRSAGLEDGEASAPSSSVPRTTASRTARWPFAARRVRIPSHPAQPSLNLSHAVMVAAYEVFRAGRATAPGARRAVHEEKQRLMDLLREGLLAVEALLGHPVPDGFFQEWQAIFSRARPDAAGGAPARAHGPQDDEGGPPPRRAQPGLKGGGPGRGSVAVRRRPGRDGGLLDSRAQVAGARLYRRLLRRDGEAFVRDPARPLPPFARPGLFPEGVRFSARVSGPGGS